MDLIPGASEFEVPEDQGSKLMEQLRKRLPGYLVPKYVREIPGKAFKTPLG